jgi:hypothetical protein
VLRVFLLGLGFGLCTRARAEPELPARVEFSTEESAQARAGEVVVKQDRVTGNHLTASVFVQASPEAVLRAVMDLPPRLEEIDNLEGLEAYEVAGHPAARWKLDARLKIVYFSVIYECDWEQGFCSFSLDPAHESDIVQADGAYYAIAHEQGSWLEYHSITQPHVLVPSAIRRSRREHSTRQMLMGMKLRAEKSP